MFKNLTIVSFVVSSLCLGASCKKETENQNTESIAKQASQNASDVASNAAQDTDNEPIAEKEKAQTALKIPPAESGILAAPAGTTMALVKGDSAGSSKIKVLKTGKGPKKTLRYAFKEGQKENISMTISMAMDMSMGAGGSNKMILPDMKMDMTMQIAGKAGKGKYKTSYELTGADVVETKGVDPNVTTAMKKSIGNMVGTKGSSVIDNRGFQSGGKVENSAKMSAQVKQMMESTTHSVEQLSSPLPSEPVGKGAKWVLSQNTMQNGIKINQKTTFTLVSLKGNKGVLKLDIVQTAPKQKAKMNGMEVDVVSMKSTGKGEVKLNTNQIVPDSSSVNIKTKGEFQIMGQSMKMDSTTKVVTKHK